MNKDELKTYFSDIRYYEGSNEELHEYREYVPLNEVYKLLSENPPITDSNIQQVLKYCIEYIMSRENKNKDIITYIKENLHA